MKAKDDARVEILLGLVKEFTTLYGAHKELVAKNEGEPFTDNDILVSLVGFVQSVIKDEIPDDKKRKKFVRVFCKTLVEIHKTYG